MKANHELIVFLTTTVVSRAVDKSNAPNEITLFESGVRIARSVIIMIVIDVCIKCSTGFRIA